MPKQAPAIPPRPQEADIFSFGNEPPPPTLILMMFMIHRQKLCLNGVSALGSELNAIGAPTTTATSAPAPAPTAQSEYMIIPAPTGGAGTRPQPRVQPPPPPANPNPPPSSSWFDDLSDIFSGSRALTSLYGYQHQAPPTFALPPQPNPFGMAGQLPPPNFPPPPVQEPSIMRDLMDAIRNPQQNTTTAYLIGMGMRMSGLGIGPPAGYGMGQF